MGKAEQESPYCHGNWETDSYEMLLWQNNYWAIRDGNPPNPSSTVHTRTHAQQLPSIDEFNNNNKNNIFKKTTILAIFLLIVQIAECEWSTGAPKKKKTLLWPRGFPCFQGAGLPRSDLWQPEILSSSGISYLSNNPTAFAVTPLEAKCERGKEHWPDLGVGCRRMSERTKGLSNHADGQK